MHLVDFTEYLTLTCKAPTQQENSVAPAMVVHWNRNWYGSYFPEPLQKVIYEIVASGWVHAVTLSSLISWQAEMWNKIPGWCLQGCFKPPHVSVWFSQFCVCVPYRLSRFVLSVRSWATRHSHHDDQRPDSFLERIRGPELVEVSTRQSNIRSFLGARERPGGANR